MSDTVRRPRPATSLDVARRAGVSRSTVSNILNGNDARFPVSTRERVHAAAAELRYSPSLAGRSLVSGRSSTVVMLLPNTTFGGNLQDAVDEVVAGVEGAGGTVVVRFAGASQEATVASIVLMNPLAVLDLGVLSPETATELEERGIVVVPGADASDHAFETDGGIARLQARALLRNGPRTLWFASLQDERPDPYGPGRLSSLEAFCREERLPAPRRMGVPLDLPGATQALREILRATDGPRPGIVCYNDDVALALLAGARVLNADVPESVSLIGVDHTPLGQLWSPRLSTVDTDLRWFVSVLAEDLQARLEEREYVAPEFGMHVQLIDGETT